MTPSWLVAACLHCLLPKAFNYHQPPSKGGWLASPWAEDVSERIRTVLHAAKSTKHANLVLGAWGCGAFGNPTAPVAALFKKHLASEEFRGAFEHVVFAILDPLGTGNLGPFKQEFGGK